MFKQVICLIDAGLMVQAHRVLMQSVFPKCILTNRPQFLMTCLMALDQNAIVDWNKTGGFLLKCKIYLTRLDQSIQRELIPLLEKSR